jgi:hypothetical protein
MRAGNMLRGCRYRCLPSLQALREAEACEMRVEWYSKNWAGTRCAEGTPGS